ncbi:MULTISPECIES: tyrosine-type recombinase/integrase [unclassified Massilia]|uniref:tyrosine-type recombinase/integrase n=1 Tax=unclassified Massilia TaxID=2609279 RepID=UPI0017827845|nr:MULTISPECIES: tyrosine-type recombinase/integrase [unclassified Massilia]MBD8531680.1 tyrosine-type recombinase/integrase [Massilia sp. CFBP 13647]MBD8675124.1 tyrosine-type recombinase/integrase [Massilia sp. CFBP 13721]
MVVHPENPVLDGAFGAGQHTAASSSNNEVPMPDPKKWDADPVAAFKAFLETDEFAQTSRRPRKGPAQPVSSKSAAIYIFMFRKFVTWLAGQRRSFSQVSEQDLLRFIGELRRNGEQNSGITERYLRLLERCYNHLQVAPNPATSATKLATDNMYLAQNAGTEALTEEQIEAFVAALPSLDSPSANRAGRPPKAWKRRRDHAVQATVLFGGLKVAEAIGLHVDEVEDSFSELPIRLKISPEDKHDTSYEHETIVHGYGADALRRWLIERLAVDATGKRILKGDLVFPGDHNGKPMSKVTLWRQVKETFARAGIDVNRSGGRTLRNTFAAQELKHGRTKSDLQGYLGLALERSAEIYETAQPRKRKSDEAV